MGQPSLQAAMIHVRSAHCVCDKIINFASREITTLIIITATTQTGCGLIFGVRVFPRQSRHFLELIYLSVSDGLKSPANSSFPASADLIWKTFGMSSKMTSIIQAITRKKREEEAIWTRLCQFSCSGKSEKNGKKFHPI